MKPATCGTVHQATGARDPKARIAHLAVARLQARLSRAMAWDWWAGHWTSVLTVSPSLTRTAGRNARVTFRTTRQASRELTSGARRPGHSTYEHLAARGELARHVMARGAVVGEPVVAEVDDRRDRGPVRRSHDRWDGPPNRSSVVSSRPAARISPISSGSASRVTVDVSCNSTTSPERGGLAANQSISSRGWLR